jgi:hypothetical protein
LYSFPWFSPTWSSPESVSAHSGCLLQTKNGQQDKRKIPVHRSSRSLDHMVHVPPGSATLSGLFPRPLRSRPGLSVAQFHLFPARSAPLRRRKRKRHCFAIRRAAENRTPAHRCSQKERETRSGFFPFRVVSREG